MSSVWTRPNAGNVSRTPAVEGGEYADQAANPGHADGAAFVRQLIGDGAKVEATGRSIEYWSGDSMSDTGLAYNISGRATVIEAGVGERLAGFQDPIKAIFGTSICHDKTVIVKRKYVVGGAATITPERAPARTVQVREDVQSVELQRYGGDVTMNTNLFLRPADAEAEMTMKLDAQKKQLENKLVELGYNEIFDKALRLPDVAVRANPTFSNSGGVDVDSPEARAYARTVYFRSCFGAFAKHEFPLANLLASCKTSGAYTSADGPGTVLVIPHGSSEMLRYTKSSSMDYSISGLRTADQKPVTMAIENVAQDPSSGVKIMVHVPPTSYARSAALPSTDKGMLSEDVSIFMVYPHNAFTTTNNGLIPDLQNGGWKRPSMPGTVGTVPYDSGDATPAKVYDEYEKVLREYETNNVMTLAERRLLNEYFSKSIRKVATDLEAAGTDVEEQKKFVKKILAGNMRINLSPTMSGLGRGLRQGRTAGTEDPSSGTDKIIIANGLKYDFGACTSIGDLFYDFVPAMLAGIDEPAKKIFIGNAIKPFSMGDSTVATKRVENLYTAMTKRGDSTKAIHNNFDVFDLIGRTMACVDKGNTSTLGSGVMHDLIKMWAHVEIIKRGLNAEPTVDGGINLMDSPQLAILKLSKQYSWIMDSTDSEVNKSTNVGQLAGMFTYPPGHPVCQLGPVSEYLDRGDSDLLKKFLVESCRLSEADATDATTPQAVGQFEKMKESAVKSVKGNKEIGIALAADEWIKWIAEQVGFPTFACLSLPLTAVVTALIHEDDVAAYGDRAEQVKEHASTAWGKLCNAATGCTDFISKLPSTIKIAGFGVAAVSMATVAASLLHKDGFKGVTDYVTSTFNNGLRHISNVWSEKDGGKEAASAAIKKLRALNSTTNGGYEAYLNGTDDSYLTQSSARAPLGRVIGYAKQIEQVRYGTTSGRALVVRELRVKMSSAIIAKCGSDTGELLVGYPMTGVSTNQRTESMTVALRVYLGAILKKPENVTIIPHVAFEGIVVHDDWFNAVAGDQSSSDPVATNGVEFTEVEVNGGGRGRTGYAYPGTYANRNTGKIEIQQENAGPLGHLDDPYYMECVNGLQVYKAAPMQTVSYSK